MSEEAKPETAEEPSWVKAVQQRMEELAASVEAAKPKPEKSDRALLEEIQGGLASIGEALTGLVQAKPTVDPPPAKPAAEPPAERRKKENPWTRHQTR